MQSRKKEALFIINHQVRMRNLMVCYSKLNHNIICILEKLFFTFSEISLFNYTLNNFEYINF